MSRKALKNLTDRRNGWRNKPWRINVYTCESCCHQVTTVDVDLGVTPFTIGCPKCSDSATSSMYPQSRPIPDWIPKPSQEWYKPEITLDMDEGTRDHVKKGGLTLRPRTDATPLIHGHKEVK